jgi:hypothetical protein
MILPLMLLTVACQPATTELTEERKAAIAAEVRQAAAEMFEAAIALDTDRWLSYWPSELEQRYQGQPALFVNRLDIYPTAGRMRAVWEPSFAARSDHDFATENEYVAVLGEDAALWVYEGTYAVTDTLGNTAEPAPWTVSAVWVRGDAGWKILHWHQSWNPTD